MTKATRTARSARWSQICQPRPSRSRWVLRTIPCGMSGTSRAFPCRLYGKRLPLRPEDQNHRLAGLPGLDVLHRLRRVGVREHALAGTEHDREDHQVQLVDEVVRHQPVDELRAARDEDVALELLFQLADLLGQVA